MEMKWKLCIVLILAVLTIIGYIMVFRTGNFCTRNGYEQSQTIDGHTFCFKVQNLTIREYSNETWIGEERKMGRG